MRTPDELLVGLTRWRWRADGAHAHEVGGRAAVCVGLLLIITEEEKSVLKKYEGKFVALEPAPEYVIDRINNGLYR